MGVGGSTLPANHRIWSLEPPPLPAPPFLITNDLAAEIPNPRISQVLEDMPELVPHKTKSTLSPRHEVQTPHLYDPGKDDSWHQKTSLASSPHSQSNQPSLSLDDPGFRLSYMPTSNRLTMEYSIQQERLEWSRTISHLASANQQLATAYSSTLKHLEELYSVLKKGNFSGADGTNMNCNESGTSSRGHGVAGSVDPNALVPTAVDGGVVLRTNRQDRRLLRRGRVYAGRQTFLVRSRRSRLDKMIFGKTAAVVRPKNVCNLNQTNESCDYVNEQGNLQNEIEDLKYLRWETQQANRRLIKDLEIQKQTVHKFKEDCELSKNEYEQRISERDEKIDQVLNELELSKKEMSRLLKELDTFRLEKATACEHIANLEKELHDLKIERDQIIQERQRQVDSLQQQLNKVDGDKKKQVNELMKDKMEHVPNISCDEVDDSSQTNIAGTVPNESEFDTTMTNSVQTCLDESSTLDEFKKELLLKREARQRAIAAVSSEMDRLRRELDAEKVAHSETSKVLELLKAAQMEPSKHLDTQDSDTCDTKAEGNRCPCERNREEIEAIKLIDILKVSKELMDQMNFHLEKMDDLRYQLENNPNEHKMRINDLQTFGEDVRRYVRGRGDRISILKDRLAHILVKLSDKDFLDENDDIKDECRHQVDDLVRIRRLCQVQIKTLMQMTDSAVRDSADAKGKLESVIKHHDGIEEELRKAEEKVDIQDGEILNLESQLGLAKADCRDLQSQMSVINGLFTQMLLGASSSELDLDRLTQLLQENHDLISDITKTNNAEALPKLLLELIEQVDGRSGKGQDEKKEEEDTQEENIAHNLPKVWRILMELLSCYEVGTPSASALSSSAPDSCYKSVDTPSGPRLVISVSKTYIRLKELILEKKHLEKEMNRMKQLNSHLENKLVEQEKRLSTVSDELSKTWTIVDRMQVQHQQLHTHEKILRYELQQKRKMLQELKQELEYCREKWESARQKNTNTELQWRSLRREFAARKAVSNAESFNSGESGFSDDKDDDTDEEELANSSTVGKMMWLVESRRRMELLNDGNRTDTESEKSTDNKLSKSKPLVKFEERNPTLEKEASRMEEDQVDSSSTQSQPEGSSELDSESSDPLDRALSNVIRNLIQIDGITYTSLSQEDASSSSSESLSTDESNRETLLDDKKAETEGNTILEESENDEEAITLNHRYNRNVNPAVPSIEQVQKSAESTKPDILTATSVFSIGPFPDSSSTHEDKVAFFGRNDSPRDLPCSSDASTTTHQTTNTENCFEPTFETDNTSVDSCSSLDTVEESSSGSSQDSTYIKDTMDARAARLKRLEEQAEWLVKKMSATNRRGSALSNRLEELHEVYGTVPKPPVLPDVLPAFRIATELNSSDVDVGDTGHDDSQISDTTS